MVHFRAQKSTILIIIIIIIKKRKKIQMSEVIANGMAINWRASGPMIKMLLRVLHHIDNRKFTLRRSENHI
jgi:hypothetical protein